MDFNQTDVIKLLSSMGVDVTEDELAEKLDVLVTLGWATVEMVDGERVYSSTEKGVLVREHLMDTDPECAQCEKTVEGKEIH